MTKSQNAVAVHYVGAADVLRFSKADLVRVDPEYQGGALRWDVENNFLQQVEMTDLLQQTLFADTNTFHLGSETALQNRRVVDKLVAGR